MLAIYGLRIPSDSIGPFYEHRVRGPMHLCSWAHEAGLFASRTIGSFFCPIGLLRRGFALGSNHPASRQLLGLLMGMGNVWVERRKSETIWGKGSLVNSRAYIIYNVYVPKMLFFLKKVL